MGTLIKESNVNIDNSQNNKDINTILSNRLYSISEVIDLYPKLSKYTISNAINEGKLSVVWIGNKRFFYLKDIEKYINSLINSKKNSDNSWRIKLE